MIINLSLPHVHSVTGPKEWRESMLTKRCNGEPWRNAGVINLQTWPWSMRLLAFIPIKVIFGSRICRQKMITLAAMRESERRRAGLPGESGKSSVWWGGGGSSGSESSSKELQIVKKMSCKFRNASRWPLFEKGMSASRHNYLKVQTAPLYGLRSAIIPFWNYSMSRIYPSCAHGVRMNRPNCRHTRSSSDHNPWVKHIHVVKIVNSISKLYWKEYSNIVDEKRRFRHPICNVGARSAPSTRLVLTWPADAAAALSMLHPTNPRKWEQ